MTVDEVFAFLDGEERALFVGSMEERSLAPGEDCFVEGAGDNFMAFVLEGRLAVKKPTEFPGKSLVIALLGPGAPVGEGALFPGGVHGATVTAVGEVRLAILSRAGFDAIRQQAPDLAVKVLLHLLSIVNLRLRNTSHRLSLVL